MAGASSAPTAPVALELYRVWPDGTVQALSDGFAHSHLSDDFFTVLSSDEESALHASEPVGDLLALPSKGGSL